MKQQVATRKNKSLSWEKKSNQDTFGFGNKAISLSMAKLIDLRSNTMKLFPVHSYHAVKYLFHNSISTIVTCFLSNIPFGNYFVQVKTWEFQNIVLSVFLIPGVRSGVITCFVDNKWEGNAPSLDSGVRTEVESLRQPRKYDPLYIKKQDNKLVSVFQESNS